MSATELSETDRAASEAVFVFGTIAMERGGVTRTIFARMRLYAAAGVRVRLLLIAHGPQEDEEEAALRQAWGLPDSVEVRYFWREAAPAGGGADVDPLVHAREEPGLTSFSGFEDEDPAVRFYEDGVLVKTKCFASDGRLVRIDRHDGARRVTSREYYDPHGRLVRIDEVNPDTARPELRRMFDRSGQCWLTSWLTKAESARETVRHIPAPVAYDDFGECAARWVDDVLADSVSPVVFSDVRNHDIVLLCLKHPSARTVSVLHNGHTTKPYRAQDPTRPGWLPLLSNIDSLDAVVALTERQRKDIAARYGASNLTVINHPTPPAPELTVRRQPASLAVVARLEPQKRLEHAIRAFAIAAESVPDARFDIYGTGGEAGKLASLVEDLGVADRVRFPGFTDRALEIFSGASATVLSSWFEGFPLVLTEAMGVGTPVISYDLNYGPDEVIRHEVDGLLVGQGDIEGLASAMVRVLGDPDHAATLGERAREVTERFPEWRWERAWLDLLDRLARSGGAPTGALADTATDTAADTAGTRG